VSRGPSPSEPTPTQRPLRRARSRASLAVLLAAALVAVLATACGGSEGGTSSTTTVTTPPLSVTVSIADGEFDPRRVEVAVGGSVTWVNDDVTPHLLVSTTPNVIQSPLIGKAGSYTRSFSRPGEYRYYCNIHNSMKGVVVVR
jgi:plastocyanin